MSATPNLGLPYLAPAQAQKHVTHNEALRALDALVQIAVQSASLSAPPGSPGDGQRWIVGPSPSGAWAGQAGRIAAWQDGGWVFYSPQAGWQAHVIDEGHVLVWRDGAWSPPVARVDRLGVGTDADATNRLTVSGPATLLNHAGAGHQLKLNKAAAGETASLLFQTGFSGRAEMGTAGSDDFAVKVSADGAAWTEALVVEAATGRLGAPQGLALGGGSAAAPALGFAADADTGLWRIAADTLGIATGGAERLRVTNSGLQLTGSLTGTAVQASATDTTAGRLLTVGAFGLGATGSPGENITTAAQLDGLRGLRLDRVTSPNVPTVGGPSGSGGAAVLTTGFSSANAAQLWLEVSSPYRIWRRGFASSTWGPWQRVAVLGIEAPEQVSTAAELDAIVGLNTVRIASVDVPSVGGPSGATGSAIILSVGFSASTAHQLWFETSSPYRIWQRARVSSGWQPWRLLTNLSTSNANGVSYRYSEGEQRCIRTDLSTASVATADGSVFESADVTWTFPQAFLTGAIPVVNFNGQHADVIGCRILSVSETSVTFRLRARASIGSSVTIRAEATGRWA